MYEKRLCHMQALITPVTNFSHDFLININHELHNQFNTSINKIITKCA